MTPRLATRVTQADRAGCRAAARILGDGALVAFPTETVYGLGADATNGEAITRLYAATGSPRVDPLIAHVCDLASAQALARFDEPALRLAGAFWPGPLTLVLTKTPGCPVSYAATEERDTIGVRVPDHPVAQSILAAFGKPVVVIPANRFGRVASTRAAHVLADLRGRIDLIVNGGATPIGLESTIVACVGAPALLRSGAVSGDAIAPVIERSAASLRDADPSFSPDMFASHGAPKAPLRLDADAVQAGDALLAFGPVPAWAQRVRTVLNLSPKRDLAEAAANLFSHLRELDGTAPAAIAVMPIPRDGLGQAVNDRLAAPRRVGASDVRAFATDRAERENCGQSRS